MLFFHDLICCLFALVPSMSKNLSPLTPEMNNVLVICQSVTYVFAETGPY